MNPLPGTHAVKPKPCYVLRLIYLFAGRARWADIAKCLASLIAEFNASPAFPYAAQLEVEGVDTLRGGKPHDLLDPPGHKHDLGAIATGGFTFIFLSPPCNAHSRATFANVHGQAPVRDAVHPRGFPGLPALRKKVQGANILHDFAIQVLANASDALTLAMMGCPDDLGATPWGDPCLNRSEARSSKAE